MNTIYELFFSLTNLAIIELRRKTKVRNLLAIILTIILCVSLFINVYKPIQLSKDYYGALQVFIGFLIFFLIIVLASFTNITLDKDELKTELNKIKKEREKIIEKISEKENNVIGTIQLSLNQITEYYTINLSQARSSYRWSITAIITGLVTLLAGAWLIYFQENPNVTVGIITGISGIVIEFIGASNIYIYNKSLAQLNLYFRELINIQDTMLAIELCEKIDSTNPKKLEITEKIILSLMGRSSIRESQMNFPKKNTTSK
ncbi:TRADD-N-associated membrane domain-containing protein [Flavobacterium aquidurense]|uniref:TRADD-N-associated membrane domain-containing protein n=1 Tax=Flavobacterium aquidurense TaxID=362413 RepID=UPI0037124355